MINHDEMDLGFLLAGFAWSLWWNIDWRRYIKFYVRNGPPYRRGVEIGFRVFFAACSLGAGYDLAGRLFQSIRPIKFYRDVLVVAGVWFIVIILAVKTMEWINSRRKSTISPRGEPPKPSKDVKS
jgi:hypothetical protein